MNLRERHQNSACDRLSFREVAHASWCVDVECEVDASFWTFQPSGPPSELPCPAGLASKLPILVCSDDECLFKELLMCILEGELVMVKLLEQIDLLKGSDSQIPFDPERRWA